MGESGLMDAGLGLYVSGEGAQKGAVWYVGLTGPATTRVGRFGVQLPSRKNIAEVGRSGGGLADAANPQTCAFRGVTEYISAAPATDWDLTAGYLFPVVDGNGERGSVAFTAPRMTATLQENLRPGGLPDHFTMHS